MYPINIEAIRTYSTQHPIKKLSLFGSVLRADFRPDSDVDVLVEFTPESKVTYLDLAVMQTELSALLGKRVDLLTPNALSPYFREQVLKEAVSIYEHE